MQFVTFFLKYTELIKKIDNQYKKTQMMTALIFASFIFCCEIRMQTR